MLEQPNLSEDRGEPPWGIVDDYALIVYPFIQRRSAMELGLTDRQRIEFGAILRAIHRTSLPEAVRRLVPRESFVSAWVHGVRQLQHVIEQSNDRAPHARALAAVWKEKRSQITHIVERAEALGRRLQAQHCELVLCHTDPHTNNVLIDSDGRLLLVDWDAPLLAPKERDLHFVVGSVIGRTAIGPREVGLIFLGYGPTDVSAATRDDAIRATRHRDKTERHIHGEDLGGNALLLLRPDRDCRSAV